MPLALVGRTKDAVVSVNDGVAWQEGVVAFLRTVTDDSSRIARHIDLLERRAAGDLPWATVLAGATLPNGRPMPPSRRYAEMLVAEDRLPLYEIDTLRFSLDLHNPGNEAGIPHYDADRLELALVADIGYFSATTPGTTFDLSVPADELIRRRAANGTLLGDLVARLVEATGAGFAYADISATGWRVSAASSPERVVHAAPTDVRPWDFLWSITAWGPERLDEALAARIERLEITEKMRSAMDASERPHYRLVRRRLACGALFLQYRFLFGTELRSTRAACDTPLARQAGLRSTALLFRA
jgi:hypothetical protein